jgi:hypothetical protein
MIYSRITIALTGQTIICDVNNNDGKSKIQDINAD